MGRLDAPCFASISRSAHRNLKIGRPRMVQERGGDNFPRTSIVLVTALSAHGVRLKSPSVSITYAKRQLVKTFCLGKKEVRTVELAARAVLSAISIQ